MVRAMQRDVLRPLPLAVVLMAGWLLLAGSTTRPTPWQDDAALRSSMLVMLRSAGMDSAVAQGRMGVTVIDLSGPVGLRCSLNGAKTFAAASITKTLVLCAAHLLREDQRQGRLPMRPSWERLLVRNEGGVAFSDTAQQLMRSMIRSSNNHAATQLINAIGLSYIDSVSVALGLYDMQHGGLWLGAPYGAGPTYRRDPVAGLSHAASSDALARLFGLLGTRTLVDSTMSADMLNVLGRTHINNRFYRALRKAQPGSTIYRKTGTWYGGGGNVWAHEACLVERGPVRYVAAVTCKGGDCPDLLDRFIVPLDTLMAARAANAH